MNQPITDRQWAKTMVFARAYGSGPNSGTRMHRLIRPLFWEQREQEKNDLWMQKMADMIRTQQEMKNG